MRQLVKEKENSEFKPVKLLLKIDLVSYPARAEGLVNRINALSPLLSLWNKRKRYQIYINLFYHLMFFINWLRHFQWFYIIFAGDIKLYVAQSTGGGAIEYTEYLSAEG